jgi:hypothetical protein
VSQIFVPLAVTPGHAPLDGTPRAAPERCSGRREDRRDRPGLGGIGILANTEEKTVTIVL